MKKIVLILTVLISMLAFNAAFAQVDFPSGVANQVTVDSVPDNGTISVNANNLMNYADITADNHFTLDVSASTRVGSWLIVKADNAESDTAQVVTFTGDIDVSNDTIQADSYKTWTFFYNGSTYVLLSTIPANGSLTVMAGKPEYGVYIGKPPVIKLLHKRV